MSWTNNSKNSASYSNESKNSASFTNVNKKDIKSHLWSPDNDSIWDDDTYPWQDDETINNTNLTARTSI